MGAASCTGLDGRKKRSRKKCISRSTASNSNSDARRGGLQSIGYIGNRFHREADVDVVRIGDGVDIQSAVANGYTHVLRILADIDKFRVRIFFQFLGYLAKHRKVWAGLRGGLL